MPSLRFMKSHLLRLLKAIGSGIRAGWLIFGVALLAVLVIEAGARLALEAGTRGLMDRLRAESPAGAVADRNSAWFHDLLEEQQATQYIPRPYVHWRQHPYQGRYLNIDRNGLRATWNPPPPDDPGGSSPAVRLFTFGGSTMWGWGARDDYTIASHLSKLLHELGYPAQVTNYGEVAYVSTQGIITLLRCIQQDQVPDIVLFYDGFEEINRNHPGMGKDTSLLETGRQPEKSSGRGPWAEGQALLLRNLWGSRRVAKGLQRRFFPESSPDTGSRPIPLDEARIRQILRRYQANLTLVEALGRYYGFEALFYWQPTLYSKRRRSPDEQTIEGSYSPRYEEVFDDIYRRVRQSESLNRHPGFHDLGALFDDSDASYYVDAAYLSEAGNRLVAEAMVDHVIALIERRRAGVAESGRIE